MITINSVTEKDDIFWFTSKEYAALFEFNCKTEKARLVKWLELPQKDRCSLYGVIKYVNDKIYIAPYMGTKLYIYDIENQSLLGIPLVENEIYKDFKFRSVLQIEQKLYFFAGCFGRVLVVNCENDTIGYINYCENLNDYKQSYFATTVNNNICLADKEEQQSLFTIDLVSKTVERYFPNFDEAVLGVCNGTNEKYVLFVDSPRIMRISEAGNRIIDIPYGFVGCPRYYVMAVLIDNNLWVLPFKGNMILNISKDSCSVECFKMFNNKERIVYQYSGLLGDKKIWAYNKFGNSLDIIETMNRTIKSYFFDEIEGLDEILKSDQIIDEHIISLKCYLDMLSKE